MSEDVDGEVSGQKKFLQDYQESVNSALADSLNAKIYTFLQERGGEMSLEEICEEFELGKQEIVNHLHELEESMLVERDYQMNNREITLNFEACEIRNDVEVSL